jgi:hypothetical protein
MMVPVSKDEFFAALYADKRDIMPSLGASRDYSEWLTNDYRRIAFGRTIINKVTGGTSAYYLNRNDA